VRQRNSGEVEDFIWLYSAVYLRVQKWKNYWNRSTIAKVIVKIKVARFFVAHGVYMLVASQNHLKSSSKLIYEPERYGNIACYYYYFASYLWYYYKK